MVSKSSLRAHVRLPAPYVDDAADWSNKMVSGETRSPGDTDNAMRRLGKRYAISHSVFWNLRYRRPQSIAVDLYLRVAEIYDAECERQQDRFREQRKEIQEKTRLARALVRAADGLAGEAD